MRILLPEIPEAERTPLVRQLLDIIALSGAGVMGVAFFVRACGNLRVLAAREPYTAP